MALNSRFFIDVRGVPLQCPWVRVCVCVRVSLWVWVHSCG